MFLPVHFYASCLQVNLNWDLHHLELNSIVKWASDRALIHAVDHKMQTEHIQSGYSVLTIRLRISFDYLNMTATNGVELKYQTSFRFVSHIPHHYFCSNRVTQP